MPVLVSLHLAKAKHSMLTLFAVVVRLLRVVRAARRRTQLSRGELLKARGHDGVELLVLPSVGNNFVGVRAEIVALQTMEMTRALGLFAWQLS